MGALSISLGMAQTQNPETGDLRVVVDVSQDFAIPLPAGSGNQNIWVMKPKAYKGFYSVQTQNLAGGPVNMLPPQIVQESGTGPLGIAVQGLWAYDELGNAPVRSYRWQRNGVDIPGAIETQYIPVSADAGQTLNVIETATDANGAREQISNGAAVTKLPDSFGAVLETGGLLQITGNDGRNFSVDDAANHYDGTYSIPAGSLASGPVVLVPTVLAGDGSPEAGETLSITPALFAYDAALGGVTVSYSTNGVSRVDESNPAAPRLLIDAADAGRTITVTARAVQGANTTDSVSNGVAIAALPDPFKVVLETGGLLQITGNDGRSFTVDDPAGLYDGTYSASVVALTAGPVALMKPILTGDITPAVGETLSITPALFAYDAALGGVTVSYSTNGVSRVDASNPAAPTLLVDAADAGRTITVTARAAQGANDTSSVSNGVAVAALPDRFGVVLETGGLLQVTSNDGRSFIVDDAANHYDGTYSIPAGSLASGPVALVEAVLSGNGSPEVGEILSITPALFAYDPSLGSMSVSYTTNATNAVDTSNPAAPTLRIDTADAGGTITVTATAAQGGQATSSVSNGVAVAALPDPFEVVLVGDGTLQIVGNDGRRFTVDESTNRHDGTYSITVGDLAAGPVALVAPVLTGDGSPAGGETLAIVPPLFAYDPDLGAVGSVAYTTTGTNAVDMTDPDNPTLRIDPADAGSTITVAATLMQTGVGTGLSTSNGVSVSAASGWSAASVKVGDSQATIAVGNNQPAAPSAPSVAAGDAQVTLIQG